ncbi:hypothetical protein [Kibdelosporangium aridum]|uniref:hypothetical protein n=1 Tax=Kibdelosporangium aridum TaxID=2030 RepID=UPI0005272E83
MSTALDSTEQDGLIDRILFAMWEDEFTRRAAGEEPQNTFHTILPPKQESTSRQTPSADNGEAGE